MSAAMRVRRSPLRSIFEARRGQGLDRGEEPDPEVGQDPERRPMGDVTLEVPERGPGDGQDAHRRDGQRDIRDVADERGATDEPRGHGHQADARADGQEAQQHARDDPPPVGHQQPELASEDGHAATARPSASVTTRSANVARRMRWEMMSTVRPRTRSGMTAPMAASEAASRWDVASSRTR